MMQIHFERNLARGGAIDIYAFIRTGDGRRIPFSVVFEQLNPIGDFQEQQRTATLNPDMAHQFFEALKEGMRRIGVLEERSPTSAELEARKDHLDDLKDKYEDMRAIAVDALKNLTKEKSDG